jgi:hypothetical protein
MFEIVIGLTVFGSLYVAVVESFEKWVDRRADAEPAARLHRHVAP